MSEDSYEYSGFERNCPEVDDGFYLVKNGITYKVDLPMDKTRFTKRINILTGEVYYPSNADHIRAMTDEELADEILRWFNWLNAVEWDDKRIIGWLKQEVET